MNGSSSISYITQMLDEPGMLSNTDKSAINELVPAHPYFVPARYLQAAVSGQADNMQLYRGNFILFREFMEKAMVKDTTAATAIATATTEDPLIQPLYTEDYFKQQGIEVSNEIPQEIEHHDVSVSDDASLMVVMSFSEWLAYFKSQNKKAKEEAEGQKAIKSMWQKEKLAAAMEEENEEIPENVFEMAMNSIASEEDLASEPLADIYIKQGKYDKAVEMYKKLSLRNPSKSAYFARKIEAILKERS